MDEHVIPQAVCGGPPELHADAWRPVLNVHRACDDVYKRSLDEFYDAFQHSMSTPSEAWNENKARKVAERIGELRLLSTGEIIGTLKGMDQMIDAVQHWVRGLHALLFSFYLPFNQARYLCTPVESFSDESGVSIERQASRQREVRSICAKQCIYAHKLGKLHSLRCWGGRIDFVCTWCSIETPQHGRQSKWPTCFWMLNIPGLREWTWTQRKQVVPWAGIYSVPSVPDYCMPLSHGDMSDWKLYNEAELPLSLKPIMPSLF